MHIQLLDFKYFLDKTEKLLTSYGYSPDYCYFSHYDSLTLSFSKEEKNDNLYFTYPQKGGAKTVYFDDILKLSFRDDEMEKSIHLFIEVFLFIYKKLKDRIENKNKLSSFFRKMMFNVELLESFRYYFHLEDDSFFFNFYCNEHKDYYFFIKHYKKEKIIYEETLKLPLLSYFE